MYTRLFFWQSSRLLIFPFTCASLHECQSLPLSKFGVKWLFLFPSQCLLERRSKRRRKKEEKIYKMLTTLDSILLFRSSLVYPNAACFTCMMMTTTTTMAKSKTLFPHIYLNPYPMCIHTSSFESRHKFYLNRYSQIFSL